MKIDRNETKEFFIIDCKARFGLIHMPSGEFCGRSHWMTMENRDKWETKFAEFLAKHPNASVIVDDSGEILDNVNDFPQRGGQFEIGDIVMVFERDHDYCADKIVGISAEKTTIEHPVDKGSLYLLESGNKLYWDIDNDLWMTTSKTAFSRRARRPVDGEEQLTLNEKIDSKKAFGM
jgi:hypothetical protein